MSNKHKHLEMIQGIITRMASNSFMLKGWAVTLIAGILMISSKETIPFFSLAMIVPIVLFWVLDSYYLAQEREFRKFYDSVAKRSEEEIDFRMNAHKTGFKQTWACIISMTEIYFYSPLVIVALTTFLVLLKKR